MSKHGQRIIDSMKDLLSKIENDEPLEVVEVRREDTPDGPLHTRQRKKIKPSELNKNN